MASTMPNARKIADVQPSPRLDDYPVRVLAADFDTYVETYSMVYPDEVRKQVENSRRVAEAMDTPMAFAVTPTEPMQVSPHGARGFRFVLENPDMMILIRTWDAEWNTTVRYLSAGLWQCGIDQMRARARAALESMGQHRSEDAEPVLSRFDYAIDFDAPGFASEAAPELVKRFVAPAHTKWAVHGKGSDAQTFTIGKMPGLQVQVYNKLLEIREASGKDWFRDIWQVPDDRDEPVWRIECRFGGEYLKDRNIRGYGALMAVLPGLVAGALIDRRLTEGDSTRVRRATVHPMWWRAWEEAGKAGETIAKGRRVTGQQNEVVRMAVRNIAGSIRSAVVARDGDFDPIGADDLIEDVKAAIADDRQHGRKVERAQQRYQFLGVPQ